MNVLNKSPSKQLLSDRDLPMDYNCRKVEISPVRTASDILKGPQTTSFFAKLTRNSQRNSVKGVMSDSSSKNINIMSIYT